MRVETKDYRGVANGLQRVAGVGETATMGLVNHWQFWAILSASFAALTAVFAKLGVKNIPPDVAMFVRTVVILGFVAGLLAASGQLGAVRELSRTAVGYLVLSGLATGASWLCYFRALHSGPASRVAAIDKLSVVLVAVFAAVVLGERLSPAALAGVVMIAAGAALVAAG